MTDPRRKLLGKLLEAQGIELPDGAPLETGPIDAAVPLSMSQERLWFLHQLDPQSAVYHISRALRLKGRLNCQVLTQAFNEVVQRHEILRTRFPCVDNRPTQAVAPPLESTINIVDLTALSGAGRRGGLPRLLADGIAMPFEIERGPLMRAELIKLADRDHILLLVLHQLVCDGWSVNLLLRELACCYGAIVKGEAPALPDIRIQYGKFAAHQRAQLRNSILGEDLAYWKKRLANNLSGVALAMDRPRPARQSFRGGRFPLIMPASLTGRLRRLGASEQSSMFVVLIAAFNVLLWRYSGQDDISVGFPAANRNTRESQNLIGFFVNTLVLRTDLSGPPTFRQLLRRVRRHCRDALAHQEMPFDRLVEELRRERDLSRNPLFQVMFAYQNYPAAQVDLPGLKVAAMDLQSATAKFDLTFSLMEEHGCLNGFIEYSADLFDRSTIARMARHWTILLRGIAADPDRRIANLPLLDKAESHRILVQWNRTDRALSRKFCIHELFEAQVRRTPDAVALESGGRQFTYRELNGRANQLAGYLQKRGIGPERLVGVCMERSPEMVIGLLAILKSGGAYLSLDPEYPSERIAFMLDDVRTCLLLTQEKFAADERSRAITSLTAKLDMRVVCVDRDWPAIEMESAKNRGKTAAPRNLAYVIYTSGSTGRPKGVAIEHRNAVAFLQWAGEVFSPAELAGVLASTSICFDLSVFELFAPLSRGGKVILVQDALGAAEFGECEDLTLINTVPSAIAELLDAGALPRSVRTVNLAGEPLKSDLVRRLYESGKVSKVYDLYGPSETTTYSTFALRRADAMATIGRPIANTKIYLLDAGLKPVPVGVPGEIYIGGAGVARGYVGRPEHTSERFLRDPFAKRRAARMYRTGDLARYFSNGDIEYLGRVDNQVKIRGFRIELGEVEAALAAHPAVRECVVMAREVDQHSNQLFKQKWKIENPKSDRQLVAYIVANPQETPTVAELRAWLGRRLPEFMLPSTFVALEALPLSPNGKVNRLALPPPDFRGPRLAKECIAPRTAIEELVAQVWREVLNVEQVGVFDNFFDLGGHSLLATRVVARLRAQIHVGLALRKFFELPTVAGLAGHIEVLRREHSGVAFTQISAAPDRRRAPLSSAQRRLWFLYKRDGDLTAYNMPAAYRVKGHFQLAAFENALNGIVQRHSVLRSAIVETGGEPLQEILPEVKLAVPIIDLSRMARVQREREIDRYAAEDAEQPFDLQQEPLLRVKVLRVSKDDHVLLVNFHHIICDGSSLAVFYQELARRYEALLEKRELALAPPALQYSDFAWWQDRALRDGALATEIAYWKRQLSGLRSVDLPADYARKEAPTYRGGKLSQRLPAELARAVKELSRAESVTLFMTLLAALKIMLARLSGQDDVVVGSTIAGRTRPEVDGLIGFFINALALRTDLSGNPTFVELLGRVRAICLDAYTHQDLPFERLVEELNPERDPGRNPLFQVLFNMADIAERELTLFGCKVVKLHRAAPGAKFDLVFQAPEADGCIELTLVYNTDLFSKARAQSMLDQWAGLLAQIVAYPERRLEEFSLLTPEAQALLPNPREPLDETWFGTIHQLIEHKTASRPQKVAIVDGQESWNYRELDRLSNRLAHRLQQVGVRPKDVVALYAHRDASLAAAILAVLKAGAIFAILDPAYPAARLADYLRIARPKALLQMAGAGNLPAAVEAHLHSAKSLLRVFLPRGKKLIAKQLEKYSGQGLAIEVGLDDPAYIAFTSGSTGEPKGVLGRHGPISHFLPWQNKTFELEASDRYALLSGLGYNHLHRDLFTALATGATLHVPGTEQLQDPEQLVPWLRLREISILHLTPALGRLLQAFNKRQTLPVLRRIFFGGDLLTRRDAAAMRDLAPHATIVTFYGATETQRAIGYAVVAQPATEKNPASPFVPTGRGAQDVQLLLLTANHQLAGIGELGELYVRSPHLAAGYLSDRALSEAHFIVNPFTGQARDRLYRTGELGRYLPDGVVEWVGRKERSASIRGFRVELAEVEAALQRFPGVRSGAAIFDAGSALEGARLIAYVALDPSVDADTEELLHFLGAQLPHYMVPSLIYFLERLPLNPSGKIDYAGLTQLQSIMPSVDRPYEGPRGDLEAAIEKILAQLLRLERIGRHDHFFALGGHSLLAAQAAARIRETLGVKLDLRAFLEQPTLAALCQRIEKANTQEREEIEL